MIVRKNVRKPTHFLVFFLFLNGCILISIDPIDLMRFCEGSYYVGVVLRWLLQYLGTFVPSLM
jgi:hypothetical protein